MQAGARVIGNLPDQLALERVLDLQDYPLSLFDPTPGFLAFMTDPWRWIVLRAANQVGKSMHAAVVVCRHLICNPGQRWRVYAPSREMSRQVIERYVHAFLAPHLLNDNYTEGRGFATKTVTLTNGSILQLRSYEDHPQTGAGDQLHGVWLDEVPKPGHFREAMARLTRHRGKMIVTLTPVDRPVGWFRDRVEPIQNEQGDRLVWLAGDPRPKGVQFKQYVVPFTSDNVPWLGEEAYQEQVDAVSTDASQRAQRLEGAWEGLTVDRIFTGFLDTTVCQVDTRGWNYALGIDHGFLAGRQACMLLAYKGPRVHVVGEYVSTAAESIEEDVQAIQDLCAQHALRLDQITRATGDINRVKGGYFINEKFEAAFRRASGGRLPFKISNANKAAGSRDYGFRVINYALKRGELTISPNCRALIESLSHWQGSDHGTDGKLSHAADAVRYIVVDLLGDRREYSRLRFR